MLGPIASSVMSIMRLMTPSQVKQLVSNSTKQSDAQKVKAISSERQSTESIGHDNDGPRDLSKAKIIPFDKKEQEERDKSNNQFVSLSEQLEDESKDEREQAETSREGSSALEGLGIFSAKKIKQIENEKENIKRAQGPSATIFLLSEREKLSVTNKKMSHLSGVKSYGQQLEEKKSVKNSIFDDSNGVLVDKKLA